MSSKTIAGTTRSHHQTQSASDGIANWKAKVFTNNLARSIIRFVFIADWLHSLAVFSRSSTTSQILSNNSHCSLSGGIHGYYKIPSVSGEQLSGIPRAEAGSERETEPVEQTAY